MQNFKRLEISIGTLSLSDLCDTNLLLDGFRPKKLSYYTIYVVQPIQIFYNKFALRKNSLAVKNKMRFFRDGLIKLSK